MAAIVVLAIVVAGATAAYVLTRNRSPKMVATSTGSVTTRSATNPTSSATNSATTPSATTAAHPPATPASLALAGATAAAWFTDQNSGHYGAAVTRETAAEQGKNNTSSYSIARAQPRYFHTQIGAPKATGHGLASVPVSFYTKDSDKICRRFSGTMPLTKQAEGWQIAPWHLARRRVPEPNCSQ